MFACARVCVCVVGVGSSTSSHGSDDVTRSGTLPTFREKYDWSYCEEVASIACMGLALFVL